MNNWLAALAGLTLLRLIVAAIIPLSPDETYYWVWSVNLQPGYFDHPPMVAFWIRAGTALLGNTPLGVRLAGPLAAAAGSIMLWRAGEDFFPNRHAGLLAAALLNATLILGVGSIIMTPDTPLMFFWIAVIAALGRWLATGDDRWWLGVGAAAGCGLLAKYTGLLLIAAIFLWLVTGREGRAALKTPWPWAGLLVAALVFAPNIYWNAAHGWVSYLKQGSRVTSFDFSRSAQFLAELFVGQFALVTPIIAVLMVAGLWRVRAAREGGALLLWLALLPAAVFVTHVVSGRVQANWPAVIYPAACLAAAALPERLWRSWARPALGLGFAATVFAYAQALAAPFPIPAPADPAALQLSGWQALAKQVAAFKPAFVTADEYATASELAFNLPPGIAVAGLGARWQYLGMTNTAILGTDGLILVHHRDTPCPRELGSIARARDGQIISTYRVCAITAPAGLLLLPRP